MAGSGFGLHAVNTSRSHCTSQVNERRAICTDTRAWIQSKFASRVTVARVKSRAAVVRGHTRGPDRLGTTTAARHVLTLQWVRVRSIDRSPPNAGTTAATTTTALDGRAARSSRQALTVAHVEAKFEEKLAKMDAFDSFLDFCVGFWAPNGLDKWARDLEVEQPLRPPGLRWSVLHLK